MANDNLDAIKQEPQSYAKDLFLWQILANDSLTNMQSMDVFLLTKQPKKVHISALLKADKLINTKLKANSPQEALAEFSFKYWINYNGDKIHYIQNLSILSPKNAQIAAMAISQKDALLTIDADTYANLTLWANTPAWRHDKLNFAPPKEICKNNALAKIVKRSIYAKNHITLEALQMCDCNNFEALFYLGIDAYSKKNYVQAAQKFQSAALNTTSAEDKERAYFWKYKSDGDKKALQTAADSGVYYYGMVARNLLDLPQKDVALFEGYTQTKPLDINMSSPFEKELQSKYLKTISQKNLELLRQASRQQGYEPLWAKIRNIQGEKKPIYIMPYKEEFIGETPEDKALWLSIARQESLFFPNDVSSAFAIGVMQVIPDLAHDINQSIKPLELLDPSINIPLAIKHFKRLKQNYQSPAYVAIAFNAGIGYLKNKTASAHFETNDELLALELLDYDETRQYVKRILANYIVYSKLLGVPVKEGVILQNPFSQFRTLR